MKGFIILVFVFTSSFIRAQDLRKLDPNGLVRYEFSPFINDLTIKGKIKEKYVTKRNGNPAYFVVVKDKHIYLIYEDLYNSLIVGQTYSFSGIRKLEWQPDTPFNE